MDGDTNSPVCTCWPAKPNPGSFGRRLTKRSRFCERTKGSYDDSEDIRVSRRDDGLWNRTRDVAVRSDRLLVELLRLAGALDVDIELSQYPPADSSTTTD